jgi:hypothetical protein
MRPHPIAPLHAGTSLPRLAKQNHRENWVGLMGDVGHRLSSRRSRVVGSGRAWRLVSLNCQQSGMTPPSTRHALSHYADAWSRVTGARRAAAVVVPWTRWAVPGEQVLLAAAAGRSCRVPRASSLQVRPELGDPPPAEPSDWRGGRICRRTRTSRWGWKAPVPAWRTPSRLLPRRAAAASSGRMHEAHRAHGAPAASAPDTGTGLMAGSISTGSHDGDSPGPARPWDR